MHRATNEILRGKEIWCANHLLFKCQLFDGARHETKTNKMENIRRRRDIRFISCDELTVVAFSFFKYKRSAISRATRGKEKRYLDSEGSCAPSSLARDFLFSRAPPEAKAFRLVKSVFSF